MNDGMVLGLVELNMWPKTDEYKQIMIYWGNIRNIDWISVYDGDAWLYCFT